MREVIRLTVLFGSSEFLLCSTYMGTTAGQHTVEVRWNWVLFKQSLSRTADKHMTVAKQYI